jgi:hypothetical protein
LARNQGDFSGALGDAFSQINTLSLQERQQAVDRLLLSPRGVSDPRPAATGGRGEPLPPLRGLGRQGQSSTNLSDLTVLVRTLEEMRQFR